MKEKKIGLENYIKISENYILGKIINKTILENIIYLFELDLSDFEEDDKKNHLENLKFLSRYLKFLDTVENIEESLGIFNQNYDNKDNLLNILNDFILSKKNIYSEIDLIKGIVNNIVNKHKANDYELSNHAKKLLNGGEISEIDDGSIWEDYYGNLVGVYMLEEIIRNSSIKKGIPFIESDSNEDDKKTFYFILEYLSTLDIEDFKKIILSIIAKKESMAEVLPIIKKKGLTDFSKFLFKKLVERIIEGKINIQD